MTHTLHELLGARVVDEDGRDLGHVIDLRCARAAARARSRESVRVDNLVFGKLGWLEHVGLRDAQAWEAQAKDVVRYERGAFVVRRYRRAR